MRSILTLSLPADMLESLRQKAKHLHMSVSEYVRKLVEHESQLISEDDLVAFRKEAREDLRKGRAYVLRSPKDLAHDL